MPGSLTLPGNFLVLIQKLRTFDEWEGYGHGTIQICVMHRNRCYTAVVVCGVVVNTLISIAAAGI